MVELKITKKNCGGRLDKYLGKYLKEAPTSFLYKMLRKKNIVLNGKKAAGNEILKEDDSIKLFLSDETIIKFGGSVHSSVLSDREYSYEEADVLSEEEHAYYTFVKNLVWEKEEPSILYEDADILILLKPVDVLSQTAKRGDISLNEWLNRYLIQKGERVKEDYQVMKPAVVNRLDRNTSGIILAGKTLVGLRFLSALIKERRIKKYYLTVVKGIFEKKREEKAFLLKNSSHNTVKIYDNEVDGASLIQTAFTPIAFGGGHTLLKVELITGKSHQIRAHLNHLGFPIIGDGKYGLKSYNLYYRRLGLKSQLLHSYELIFPKIDGPFSYLSERKFQADFSEKYKKILKQLEITYAFMEL